MRWRFRHGESHHASGRCCHEQAPCVVPAYHHASSWPRLSVMTGMAYQASPAVLAYSGPEPIRDQKYAHPGRQRRERPGQRKRFLQRYFAFQPGEDFRNHPYVQGRRNVCCLPQDACHLRRGVPLSSGQKKSERATIITSQNTLSETGGIGTKTGTWKMKNALTGTGPLFPLSLYP